MGTYATFKFKEPLTCPYCAEKHYDIQHSGVDMYHFNIGDKCDLFEENSIIEQEYYCFEKDDPKCRETVENIIGWEIPKFFYIVIKDGIYIGVTPNLTNAKFLGGFSEGEYEFYN